MLIGCWSCVCISSCVKRSVKSHCVREGAADPGPVVTESCSFVGSPSAVNLLHSPNTKDCFLLWVLGGGCTTESTMKGAGPRRPLWILSQAGRADDKGNSGDSFVIAAKCKPISALMQRNRIGCVIIMSWQSYGRQEIYLSWNQLFYEKISKKRVFTSGLKLFGSFSACLNLLGQKAISPTKNKNTPEMYQFCSALFF